MKHKLNTTEAARLLLQHFNLNAPVTQAELKQAYRITAMRLHPDRNEEDTTAQFQEVSGVYQGLCECSKLFVEESIQYLATDRTTDGTLLVELGQGFGPTVNGRTCERCKGEGYTLEYGKHWTFCDQCDDEGWQLNECPQCRGKKGFVSPDGSHVVCGTCNDSGKVRAPELKPRFRSKVRFDLFGSFFDDSSGKPWCHECGGAKEKLVDDKEHPVPHRCTNCRGIGEVRIFNPVIPKGRLK